MSASPETAAAAAPGAAPPTGRAGEEPRQRLPMLALLALATAVFVTSLTETLPAGLLPDMSHDLRVSESATGQTVTIYAIGTALTAIPLTAATAGWRRKRLLLTAVAGFAVANTVTALSSVYGLTMVARFLAGVAAGLAWALLAGYARRMAPAPSRAGPSPSPWRASRWRSPSACPPGPSSARPSAGAGRSWR